LTDGESSATIDSSSEDFETLTEGSSNDKIIKFSMIVSALLAIALPLQTKSQLSILIPDQCPTIDSAIAGKYGDIVDLQGTLEFFGSAAVPNSTNSVKKWDILLNGFPLINIEQNYLTQISVRGKNQKWYGTHIIRHSGKARYELFDDAEYSALAAKLATGLTAKKATSFTFNPSIFGSVTPSWSFAASDTEGNAQVGGAAWWTKSPRYARLNLWVTKVYPREKYTVTKAPGANAKGFNPGRDTIEIKETVPSQNYTGNKSLDPLGWTSSFDVRGTFSNHLTMYSGMKVGEIRKQGDDYIYELVKVIPPK
jgi:hypothetical protein